MTQARIAMGLWILLAVVVFNVTYDWQVRVSSHVFITAQLARVSRGEAPLTINDGFRPMVRQAAIDNSVWLVLIAAAGGGATVIAARRKNE
ncbi:MAG TPA: hypothetical protein VEA16_15965 [Vicinamibacterales bacterium]|nr:hypothetical protein [Vicinamibacterales bacterium]